MARRHQPQIRQNVHVSAGNVTSATNTHDRSWCVNPATGTRIFFISDPAHGLKKPVNNWEKSYHRPEEHLRQEREGRSRSFRATC